MANSPKRVISRETLLAIRRGMTDADFNSWRGLRQSTSATSTPAVKKKKSRQEGSAKSAEPSAAAPRSQSSQPKTVWERQKEERERSRQQLLAIERQAQQEKEATSEAESFHSTFSEADRLRLAQLREQLRSRSLPPPNVRSPAAPSSGFAMSAVDSDRIFGSPVAAAGGTPGKQSPSASAPKAAPAPVIVKKKVRAAEEAENTPPMPSESRTPPTAGHGDEAAASSQSAPRKVGWGPMPERPHVDLHDVLSTTNPSALNPAAREFRPQIGPEASGIAPLAPPEPELSRLKRGALNAKQSAVRRLTNAESSTTVDGRRVPHSKEFLLAMHPDYIAFYQAYQPSSAYPQYPAATEPQPSSEDTQLANGAALDAVQVPSNVPSEQQPSKPTVVEKAQEACAEVQNGAEAAAPPADSEEPGAYSGAECLPYGYHDWMAYYSSYLTGGYWGAASAAHQPPEVSAAREAERSTRLEHRREEMAKLLADANARIEDGVQAAIVAELEAPDSAVQYMDEAARDQLVKDYRRERLRTERLNLVYRTSREYDVSAKGLASLLLSILMERSKARASDREAKIARRKAAWVAKMLETATEDQVNKRLAQRRRQLEIGMSTVGYAVYTRVRDLNDPQLAVPKEVRMPVPEQLCSKRGWDGLIRQWRQRLHQYDKFADKILTPEEIQAIQSQSGPKELDANGAEAEEEDEEPAAKE